MEYSKEVLESIFNSIDIESNGYLGSEGLVNVFNEIGKHISQDDAEKLIENSGNKESQQITFEEFYICFMFKEQYKSNGLVKLSGKYINKLKKLSKLAQQKLGNLFDQKYDPSQKNDIKFNLNVGQFGVPKYQLGIELRAGLEHKSFASDLTKMFQPIEDHKVQLVYTIQANNPQLVKERLKDFIESSIDLLATFVPDEYIALFELAKTSIQFEYVTQEDKVLLRVSGEHQLVDQAIKSANQLIELFITDEFSGHARANIDIKAGFDDLVDLAQTPLLKIINGGFRASFEAQMNSEYVEASRAFFFEKFQKTIQKADNQKQLKKYRSAILTLLQSCRLTLNLDPCEADDILLELAQSEFKYLTRTFEQLVTKTKGMGIDEIYQNIPFIADLVEVFKSECKGHFTLTILHKDISLSLYQNCSTLGLFWDQLVK